MLQEELRTEASLHRNEPGYRPRGALAAAFLAAPATDKMEVPEQCGPAHRAEYGVRRPGWQASYLPFHTDPCTAFSPFALADLALSLSDRRPIRSLRRS